jgi:hypothetical protein
MGWTGTNRPQGQSALAFFREKFDHPHGRVIDAASVGFSEVYLAYEILDDAGQRRGVIAVVCLVHWYKDAYYNFGYKDIEESAGPGCCNCPERILRQLTEFDFGSDMPNQWSREWRERCREGLKKRQSRPKLRPGDIVAFPEPLEFSNGERIGVFEVQRASGRMLRLTRPLSGWAYMYYRVGRDRLDNGAEVIASPAPRPEMRPSLPLRDLMGQHGADVVGRAYRYALKELRGQVLNCFHSMEQDPADEIARLLGEAITSPQFAAWQEAA